MMSAILQEEEEVSIPWSKGILAHIAKGILPSCINDQIVWLLFGWDAMKTLHDKPKPSTLEKAKVINKDGRRD